jgi:capsular exopolysaccharide synthesis family protein
MARVVADHDVRPLHLPPERSPTTDWQWPARAAEEAGRHRLVCRRILSGKPAGEHANVAAAIQQDSARGLDELLDAARVREHEAGDEEDSRTPRIGSIVSGMPEYVDTLGSGSRGPDDGDRPVDVSRYVGALRRGAWLIALIVVPLTLTVLVVSLTLPKTYRATAKIVKTDAGGVFGSGDVETVKRRLATLETLLVTPAVLERAARRLPGESAGTLEDKVHASVDRDSNILNVVGSDGDAKGAASIANAVANAFLAIQRSEQRRTLDATRSQLLVALNRARGRPGSATEVRAIQQSLSELTVSEASGGRELQLAQAARPPAAASSPRPVQNTIFAFFAATFLAVLAAIAWDQLAPRVGGTRELSKLTGLPALGAVPPPHLSQSGAPKLPAGDADDEAYDGLRAALEFRLPAGSQHVLLVTSALAGEGKSTVTAGLGRALAQAGHRTLLVSANLRRPTLDELFGCSDAPGLANVLNAFHQNGQAGAGALIERAIRPIPEAMGPEELQILPSGSASASPVRLLSTGALVTFFDQLGRSDYDYVLVDGPPLLDLIDGQLLAQWVDGLLVVSRLDRLTPQAAVELHELLEQVDAKALGMVVVGSRGARPYTARPTSVAAGR